MNKFNDIKDNLIDMLEELGEELNATNDSDTKAFRNSDTKQTTSSEKRSNTKQSSEDEKFP